MPAAADTATFNGTLTNNSTVDAGFAGVVATVKINAGYTGTIGLARSLAVSKTFVQAAGAFTAAGQSLTLKVLTLSGGSFTASSGTTSIGGALTISGSPTFNANGGTVNFNGTAKATLSCNGVTFNLVTFTHTANTKTVSSNCSLPLGAGPSASSGGSITLNGTASGTGTLATSGLLTLGAGSSLSGFSGLSAEDLTIKGTYNFGGYSPFALSRSLVLSSGSGFTAPAGTASIGRNLTISSGATFNANGGTLNFNSATPFTLACGKKTFNKVTFTSNGNKTIGSDCTLPLGPNPSLGTGGGTILKGTLAGTGTLTQMGTFEIDSSSPGLNAFTNVKDVGSFLLSPEAVLTAPSGTLTVNGNFTINSGATFNANSGTVNFEALPVTTKTITCDEATFNLVKFTNTAKQVVSSDCDLPLGTNPTIGGAGGEIVLEGNLSGTNTLTVAAPLTLAPTGTISSFKTISLNSTLTGTGTLTSSASLTLGAAGSLSGFSGLETGGLTVNGAYNFGAYAPFDVNGAFSLNSAASLTAPAGTASFAKNFTIATGSTFNANGGTIEFDGIATFALSCGKKTFNLITFNSTANKTIGSDCTLPMGTNPDLGSGGGTTLKGTLSGSGTLTQYGTFKIESLSPGLDSFTNVKDVGSLLVSPEAVLTAPSGTLTVNGNFTVNSGAGAAFNANGGTVNFEALPVATKTIACDEASFNLVTLTNTAKQVVSEDCTLPLGAEPTIGAGGEIVVNGALTGSGLLTANSATVTLGSTGALSGFSGLAAGGGLTVEGAYGFGSYEPFSVSGDFALEPGASLTAPEGVATFAGDFTNGGGTFEGNGGTVVLNGFAQQVSGDTTFDNFTKSAEGEDTLTFGAGDTQTIAGALILKGASAGELLGLVSSSPGTPWFIEAEGSREVEWVSVEDSTNEGATISAVESADGGGNTGWSFP